MTAMDYFIGMIVHPFPSYAHLGWRGRGRPPRGAQLQEFLDLRSGGSGAGGIAVHDGVGCRVEPCEVERTAEPPPGRRRLDAEAERTRPVVRPLEQIVDLG